MNPDLNAEQKLGPNAYRLFLLQNVSWGILLLLISFALFLFKAPAGSGSVPASTLAFSIASIAGTLHSFAKWLLALSVLAIAAGVLVTWIQYSFSTFHLDEFALKIRTGFINKREILIPYRQIQDVNINRPLFYRLLGVSRLVILTAGHEDDGKNAEESEGMFDTVDANLGDALQKELMKRASVQMVNEVGQPAGIMHN